MLSKYVSHSRHVGSVFLFSVLIPVVSLSPTKFDFSKILKHPALTSKASESFNHVQHENPIPVNPGRDHRCLTKLIDEGLQAA